MDLLHFGAVGGFCIVSSDSDFTHLATRIREQGLLVMGIGRPGTPKSFVNACEIFVHTTSIGQKDDSQSAPRQMEDNVDWLRTVRTAIEATDGYDGRADGWASLSAVGDYIRGLDSAFDARRSRHKKLSELTKSGPESFKTRATGNKEGSGQIDVKAIE